MIEFKGECGHTIRAKDDDAGKVVRCSYCGREAQVPEEEDELDFLLTEVERTGDFDPPKSRRRLKTRPPGTAAAPIRPKSDFNPFGVALKMCYAAIIITVLIIVGKGLYKRVIVDGGARRDTTSVRAPDKTPDKPEAAVAPAPDARGLLATRLNLNQSGIYVTSVPPGGEVYIRDARSANTESILRDPNLRKRCKAGEAVELGPGSYEVAISLQLTDPGLRNLPGYGELRASIEMKSDPESAKSASEELEKYFIPHGWEGVSLGLLSDKSRVIVMHYEVDVDRDSWTPCTALFLPKHTPLAELMSYLPKGKAFGFDEDVVRGELAFYKVPPEDQKFIIDALSQIGMIPYRAASSDPKASYKIFWIRLVDGKISSRTVEDRKRS